MGERVILFCLIGLLIAVAIILMVAPGAVTWAVSFIK
jgi:hypothetical protein